MTPAQAQSFPWHSKLPRLASEAEFATLRDLFNACDYSVEGICRTMNVPAIEDYHSGDVAPLVGKFLDSPAEALIRLFCDCIYVREDELVRVLPPNGLDTLWSFGLLTRNPELPGLIYSTVAILFIGRHLTVCDRGNAPDGTKCELPPDVVYPAIFENTKEFLARLPESPCDAMLDIGTGTGIAAMRGAASAKHVWASDISSRCTLFTEINRRLAGISNISVVEGDMYAPVAGMTFDRIVTHPPYVPAKQTGLVFRDGGEDGEQIMRRAVEGLPQVLRPGGCFYALLMATDRKDEEFEQRIRRWLGPDEAQFDVVLVSNWMLSAPDEARKATKDKREDALYRAGMWKTLNVTFVFYGWVLIRRHHGGRPGVTGRAQAGSKPSGRHIEWLLEWESAAAGPEGVEMLLSSRPVISPNCQLQTVHRVRDGRFQPDQFALVSEWPFDSSSVCQGWTVEAVAQCDGVKTWRDIFGVLQKHGMIDADAPPEEFAQVLRKLVGGGVLRLGEYPIPE